MKPIQIGQLFKVVFHGHLAAIVAPGVVSRNPSRVALITLPFEDEFVAGIWNSKSVEWKQADVPANEMWNCISEDDFCQIIGDMFDRENFIPITLNEYKNSI